MNTPLNELTLGHLLLSNAFATYVFEGRPKEREAFFRALEATGVVNEACEQVFGMELPVLDRRLRRWLGEQVRP